MKFRQLIRALRRWLNSSRKKQALQLLYKQRYLLHHGLETTAEVMVATITEDKVGNLLPVQLWMKLKNKDGYYIYTSSRSLLALGSIPGKGQQIRVKYKPDDLDVVLIL